MTLMTPPPLDVITEFCFPLSAAINLFTLLPIQLPSKADLLVFTVVLVRFRLVDPSFYTDFFSVIILQPQQQQEDNEMLVPHSDFSHGPQSMEGGHNFFLVFCLSA